MRSVCLAILNYNGVHHLERLLPTATQAVTESGRPCPIVVLDNRSSGNDCSWLERHHPDVNVALAPKNDFLFSYNWLLAQRTEDIVVLLNNDLRLAPGFLGPLLRHFAAPDVFAVGATSRDWADTRFTCGPAELCVHHGVYSWDWQRDRQAVAHTLFTSGGFMAVDRRRFLEIGGFDRLFYPAYGEDLDLCFRAWRRGWRCIFEPASVVFHREGGTFSGAARRHMGRSQLLFQWSSLPPAASWPERAVMRTLTCLRHVRSSEFRQACQPAIVWMQWLHLRSSCRQKRTSPTELNRILARLRQPLVPLA